MKYTFGRTMIVTALMTGLFFTAVDLFATAAPTATGPSSTVKVLAPTVRAGLPAELRFYPAGPRATMERGPVVAVRDSGDAAFGADVRIGWDTERLYVDLDVRDASRGEVIEGPWIWESDSVQIAIDIAPEQPKSGYTDSCYELDFGLLPSGTVTHYAGFIGRQAGFDWTQVTTDGKRTETGYRLDLAVPWSCLSLNAPPHSPRGLGLNVLVNDKTVKRRFVEWTPGIGTDKRPNEFARVVLTDESKPSSAAGLVLDFPRREDASHLRCRYVEYARTGLEAESVRVVVRDASGREWIPGAVADLPTVAAGGAREAAVQVPAKLFREEGQYLFLAETTRKDGNPPTKAATLFVRTDLPKRVARRLDAEQVHLKKVEALLAEHPKLADDPYVKSGLAVARRFIDRVREGDRFGKVQSPEWSWLQIVEVGQVLDRTEERIQHAIRTSATQAPRPAGGPVNIKDGLFYTETRLTDGLVGGLRPYFFAGYGHFGHVCNDMPVVRDTGMTLIQQEQGPHALEPNGSLGKRGEGMLAMLRRAAEHGIKVDLLLSPHYFPEWAMRSANDLVGDFGYNIDHPKAREVIRIWLETVVPLVKNEPALFSFCLSNEPAYRGSGRDKYSRGAWVTDLTQRHGTIKALNDLYGTSYQRFEDVPVPEPKMPEGLDHQRAYYDWCMFNQRHFAAWHQWMHDLVRKHAPNVPTHIKIVPFFLSSWGDGDIATGMDPELFTEITEFAGNDCLSEPQAGDRYGYNWDLANRWYDLLHSFGNKPVFNSENHMSAGPCQHLDPRQTYTANWQEAIHHRGATTIWVWEEPLLPSLEGRMYMRPANIYAAGTAMLDVNRLARELATVARAKPKVAMLYSMNCLFWNKDYLRSKTIQTLYAALTFMGQPVTFVSERQLKQGRYTDVDWILLPEATHVTDDTVEALRQFMKRGGRIVATGCDNLRWDEYHRERTLADEFKAVKTIDLGDDDRATSRILHGLFVQDGLAVVDLIDRDTGEPAWGIEYRLVTDAKGFLVSLTNHTRRTQNVSLNLKGKAKDLVSGRSVHPDRLKLEPMTPVLLKIDP